MKKRMQIKKKLSRREFEAVRAALFARLQVMFMGLDMVAPDDMDMQRLLLAGVKEVADRMDRLEESGSGKYTLQLSTAQAFAMRAAFAGQYDFGNASGAVLLQLCNEIDQVFAESIYYVSTNQLKNANNTHAVGRTNWIEYHTGSI